jgi:hypothetical protein
MNKKKRISGKNKRRGRVPGFYVAHPGYGATYWSQRLFVDRWFLEQLRRVGGEDIEAASGARKALTDLFLMFGWALLQLATGKKESITKEWAGGLLGAIGGSVLKSDKKLRETNAGYRREKAKQKKLRPQVLFPGKVTRIAQQEFFRAEQARALLRLNRKQRDSLREWYALSFSRRRLPRIPRQYLPFGKLPKFSMESFELWWKLLWPLIQKALARLKMTALKIRDYEEFAGKKKDRKRYASDMQTECCDHLKLLAYRFDEGILH